MKKRFLAILLVCMMVVGMLPTTALALGTASNNAVKVELVKDSTTFSGKEVLRVDFYAKSGTDKPDNHMIYLKVNETYLGLLNGNSGNSASASLLSDFSQARSAFAKNNYKYFDTDEEADVDSEVMFYCLSKDGNTYICWKVTERGNPPAFNDYTHISSIFFGLKEGTTFDALPSDAVDYLDPVNDTTVVCASAVEITVNGGGDGNVFIWRNADGKADTMTVTPTVSAGEGVTIVKPEYSGSVSAPTVTKNKGGAVELQTITITGETVEYGYSETNSAASVTNWQTGTTFNGLTVGKTLYFFARVTETAEHRVKASDGTSVTVADKEMPTCNAPTGVTATYGQTLSEITLPNPGGNTDGTWSWIDGTQSVGNVGEKTFKAKFAPTDTDTYQTVSNIDVTVKVNPKSITPIIADISDQEYTGSAITPTVTVTGDDKTLVKDTDYTVEYSNNTNKGTATVTVKAKSGSNYTFSDVTKNFTIVGKAGKITFADGSYNIPYDGAAVTAGNSGTDLIYTYVGDGSVTVKWYADNGGSKGSELSGAPKDAGIYWIGVSATAGTNYGAVAEVTHSFTITPKSINGAAITLGTQATYNGTAQNVVITSVKVGEVTLSSSTDYDITAGGSATNVGNTTLTIKGKGNYAGTKTATWSLQKATPTVGDFTLPTGLINDYTGSPIAVAAPMLNSGKAGAGTVTVKYDGNTTAPTDAGGYTVTFDVAGGMNYEAATNLNIGTLAINKANYTGSITGNKNVHTNQVQTGVTFDMSEKFGVIKGAAVKLASEGTDNDNIISNVSFSGNVVKFDVASIADENKTAIINVVISCTNFHDINAVLTVKTVGKDEAGVTISGVPTVAKTYGDADFTLTGAVTAPGTNGAWEWETSNSSVLHLIPDGNKVTVKLLKAGEATVTAKYESDTTIDQFTTANIRVEKATITVAAKNQSIYVNGTVPDLTSPVKDTHYTITGLAADDTLDGTFTMKYQKGGVDATPDATKTGAYDIVISGATAPAGGNYNDIVFTPGTLTISKRPTGDGGTTTPSYSVTVDKAVNGAVSVSSTSASKGTIVTVTVAPDEGYELDSLTVADNSGKAVIVTEKDGKYIFTMPASKVTVKAIFKKIGAPSTMPFTDVKSGAWYYDDVQYVYSKGMMVGTAEDKFSPDATTTRGMIVTILYRLEGEPDVSGTNVFNDVAEGKYYADAVKWAAKNEIVSGYGNGKFGPEDAITREQMAAILYRYASYKGEDMTKTADLSKFTDSGKISGYAEAPLSWVNAEGLISGKGGGILDPLGKATRAEVSAILHRFCENVVK